MISASHAADAAMPVKAKPAAEPVPFWWFHGELEVGGRFFLNNPQKDGITSQGEKSLGKYYEYSDIRPGPFGNVHLSTGTSDGLYQIDLRAKNIGYDDQRFDLDASKAGEHYFNFQWDETPHIYSTSAQTLFNGVGSNALTLAQRSRNSNLLMQRAERARSAPLHWGKPQQCPADHQQQPATDRYRHSARHRGGRIIAGHRPTPGTSRPTTRTCTGPARRLTAWSSTPRHSGIRVDAPKPVDDTTQNFGLNGEYAGTSPWGKKFNFKVGYSGSVYQDDSNSYTVQNPFCADRVRGPCNPLRQCRHRPSATRLYLR